jgi:hypothetical protein
MTAPRAQEGSALEHSRVQGAPDGQTSSSLRASRRHLAARLAIVERRARAAAERRSQAGDGVIEDWPGLVISPQKVQRILKAAPAWPDIAEWDEVPADGAEDATRWLAQQVEEEADRMERRGHRLRLRVLARSFALDPVSLDVFLVALAPQVDRRFEGVYGFLNDDITRRWATVSLALELARIPLASLEARRVIDPASPLVRAGLVVLDGGDQPWPGREVRVPDRVAAWCLGSDDPDPDVAAVAQRWPDAMGDEPDAMGDEGVVSDLPALLGRWLSTHHGIVYVREGPGRSGRWTGAASWWAAGRPAWVCHLDRVSRSEDPQRLAASIALEATLQDAGIVAGPIDALLHEAHAVVGALCGGPSGVVLHGRAPWDPTWSPGSPLVVQAPRPSADDLAAQWARSLEGAPMVPGVDPVAATSQFRLTLEQVQRAGAVARSWAELHGTAIDAGAVRLGAREHNNPALERLAQRVEPQVGWNDLVVPDGVASQLRELAARAALRETVLGQWKMRPGGRRGQGVVALFCGESGTGKTMSAEVLAGELGIDLYVVELASVVDKYVGETEKNLEHVFAEADGVGGVLLFDEADALFAKRSEVHGANDRYANVEVAYLLQRMERFDGLALLSTNLRANIDEAFVRRLDAVVEFPMPDTVLRRALWDRSLTPGVPRGADLDLDFLAASFPLSGGNIHSICLGAAYAAASAGAPVSMHDLVRSVAREYRKLGRLCTESEFGRYWPIDTD